VFDFDPGTFRRAYRFLEIIEERRVNRNPTPRLKKSSEAAEGSCNN
jgi:hypothetical protein